METIREILTDELNKLKEDIIQYQKDTGAWASGDTAKGYEVSVDSEFSGQLLGYKYAGILQTGRGPGKVPYSFKEIIKRWIVAKKIQPKDGKSIDRMAASIAWVIHKKGTALHRDGTERDIFDTPLSEFSERLSNRLSTFYTKEITNNIFTWP